jgi:ATP-dependent Lon protease
LAWTYVGGDILFIETQLSDGKGELKMTGNLGNVMKESATTAFTWIQTNAKKVGINSELFTTKNVHIHIPEGAVPKDGPSAGITMMTALTSAFTGRKIKPYLAMTGEITLRGQVLPVGGIKEKVLAAKRSGIKEIIMCWQNEKDAGIGDCVVMICLLFVVCCLLFVVCCLLFVVCCLLFVVCC